MLKLLLDRKNNYFYITKMQTCIFFVQNVHALLGTLKRFVARLCK